MQQCGKWVMKVTATRDIGPEEEVFFSYCERTNEGVSAVCAVWWEGRQFGADSMRGLWPSMQAVTPILRVQTGCQSLSARWQGLA